MDFDLIEKLRPLITIGMQTKNFATVNNEVSVTEEMKTRQKTFLEQLNPLKNRRKKKNADYSKEKRKKESTKKTFKIKLIEDKKENIETSTSASYSRENNSGLSQINIPQAQVDTLFLGNKEKKESSENKVEGDRTIKVDYVQIISNYRILVATLHEELTLARADLEEYANHFKQQKEIQKQEVHKH